MEKCKTNVYHKNLFFLSNVNVVINPAHRPASRTEELQDGAGDI